MIAAVTVVASCGVLTVMSARPQGDFATEVAYRDVHGAVVVDVVLPDGNAYPFMVDTAAGSTVLDSKIAKRLGLRTAARVHAEDANARSDKLPVHVLKSLSLGQAVFKRVGVTAADLGPINAAFCNHLVGILGANVLTEGVLEIEHDPDIVRFARDRAALPTRRGGDTFAFSRGYWIPRIKLPLAAGVEHEFTIDTGYLDGTIDLSVDATTGFPETAEARCETTSTNAALFGRIDADPDAPCRALAWPDDMGPFPGVVAYESTENMLGQQLLALYTVRFDYPASRVTLWRNDRPAQASLDSVGFSLSRDDQGVFVRTVWKGSKPYRAGVRPGARVIQLNGAPPPQDHCDLAQPIDRDEVDLMLEGWSAPLRFPRVDQMKKHADLFSVHAAGVAARDPPLTPPEWLP